MPPNICATTDHQQVRIAWTSALRVTTFPCGAWSLVPSRLSTCACRSYDAWHKARVRAGEASDEDKKHTPVYFVIQCFMWAWAIWGSVIVFDCDDCSDAFTPANSTTDARGCDSMMYNFAFVSLVLIWSVCAFAILILLIYLLTLIDWSACGSCPRMCGSACGTSLGHCLDAYHRVFGSHTRSTNEVGSQTTPLRSLGMTLTCSTLQPYRPSRRQDQLRDHTVNP